MSNIVKECNCYESLAAISEVDNMTFISSIALVYYGNVSVLLPVACCLAVLAGGRGACNLT